MKKSITLILAFSICTLPALGWAWHDETHLAIAKAAGYEKWYNAAGADITKIKAGDTEKKNHYVNNPSRTIVTTEMVLDQVVLYNIPDDEKGHLYGSILGSIMEYRTTKLSDIRIAIDRVVVNQLRTDDGIAAIEERFEPDRMSLLPMAVIDLVRLEAMQAYVDMRLAAFRDFIPACRVGN
jgi:hypothetical protein